MNQQQPAAQGTLIIRSHDKLSIFVMGLSVFSMFPYIAGFILKLLAFPVNLRFWYGSIKPIEMIFISLYFICFLSLLTAFLASRKNQIKRKKAASVVSLLAAALAAGLQRYADSLINIESPVVLDVLTLVIYILPFVLILAYVFFRPKANRSALAVFLSIASLLFALLMLLNIFTYLDINQLTQTHDVLSWISFLSFYCYFISIALFALSMAIYFLRQRSKAR